MKNFLRVAALAICAIFMTANAKAQDNYNATTMGEKVYLETANWGQNSPFNKQIFTSYGGSTNAKAGCVPTAYAIVMRYHEFPTEGTSKTLYNCQASTYVEITDRVYDFSKMPLTNGSGWTEEQQTEVAKFFSHVLHACFPSSIGTSATTVNEGQTSKVLNDYFNYQLINASYQANFTMEQWAEKLRESISNGCPVPYAANNSGTGDTRHMFVVDGYTTGGYFHFNFGWSGSGNGWFKLDNITPSQGDNYSWNGNSQHYALFNLAPNKTPRTITATANPSSMGTVSINGGTAGSSVSAEVIEGTKATLTAHPADGYALANWTKNGVIVGTNSPIQVAVGESGNDYVANFDDAANVQIEKTCTFKISDVTTSGVNGSYCSTWTTCDGIVLSCTKGSEPAYALSTSVNTFFAKAPVGNSETMVSDITYTLTAPEGYVIKSYSFKGKSPSSSYTINVTVGENTTNVTNASAGVVISASDINSQSTSFVLGSTYTGRAGLSIMEDGVTVTIQSEGGASTPTTYTVTTTANPAEGGTAKFSVGTGSQKTQGDVENGTQITLYAVANTGYNFVNWTLNGNAVSTDATCNVNVSQAANYVANFKANTPAEPTTSLAGKNFRLKEKTTGTYMNIYDNATHSTGAKGGVNVAALNKSSDGQIFQFIESGTGYKLQSATGYYINCQAWNVDANSTTSGAVLTLESTENELEYLIHCSNGYFKIGAVEGNADIGKFVYCNESTKTNASVWVLEEVVEPEEDENSKLNVTFDGATWTRYNGDAIGTNNWIFKVVTATTPAVTVQVNGDVNNLGFSTINQVKHPYLYRGTNFVITVPEPYKIAGYKLTVKGDNFVNGTYTYTTGATTTGTGTITENGVEQTVTATGLDTRTINVNVGSGSGTAGIIITALEITYIKETFVPVMFKAEVENWRDNNPNTHLGTITVNETAIKVTPEHRTASTIEMPLTAGTTLAFTRKYRGFDFQGFYIGATSLGTNPTLTAENVAAINETTPLVAKFTATDDVTLFYDDDEFSYRIPAIAKTGTNRLVAVSDYRHNHDDVGRDNHKTGTYQVDLVMRTSDDNGLTWSAKQTIAEGTSTFGYGDAAIAANGQNILVMAVAGNVFYPNANATNKNKTYRIYSNNNGASWTKEEITGKIFGENTSLFPDAYATFFGSGKLAVDPNFNGTGNARVYGAILLKNSARSTNNYVVYSDDWGANWKLLGGSTTEVAIADEPKVEILPNGQILLSSRHKDGGKRTFNVFTYGTGANDKANGVGTWDTAADGCNNGGSNGTNGEIICLDAKRTNGKRTKILLQSQPQGGSSTWDRQNVTIWYKELTGDKFTASGIASNWTKGLQVSNQLSAYSAMALQENGEIAFFFEEAPCHNDKNDMGYSMVYVPLTIEEITGENFLSPSNPIEYTGLDIELTDAEGNIYYDTIDDTDDVAAALTAKYPFITLGENGVTTDNKYTNTVTLPFKVSNDETTAWYNIYWPSYGQPAYYPVYMSASQATDTYVPKVTESKAYGESTYNTLQNGDKISWAIYSVDNTLTFKFKNKLTGNYIQVTGVATGHTQNTKFVAEADATAFTLLTGGSYAGDYALKANINGTDGYLCSTSASYGWATHYNGTSHPGAWVKFVESPDYQAIVDKLIADIDNFGDGEGKYVANDAISGIDKDALATMPINSLNTKKEAVQTVKDSYSEITLSIPVANSGSVKILEEAVSNKFVQKGEVTIEAVPAAGYYFVNWTKPAAQASAAARTGVARNAVEVVSSDNPYTFNLTDAVSLEANFEQVVVNVVLTEIIGTNEGQTNEYRIQLDGFTNGITKETVAAKLVEKYPYIALGEKRENEVVDNGKLQINGNSYTYTNNVILPFKVSNAQNEIWHNIYWPSNTRDNDYPVYWSASSAEDTYVPKVTANYAYGDHPTYNTSNGNDKISWAIYNVNNGFEFIFKNKVTQKYIQVTSVADGNTQNVVYVENAEDATAFTIEKKPAGNDYYTSAQYSLAAYVGETKGYICSTSAGYNWATHHNSNAHQGAWIEFIESPYYEVMLNDTYAMYYYYAGVGEGKCIITDALVPIVENLGDFDKWGGLTYNTINAYAAILEEAWRWPAIKLNIKPTEGGTTSINGEENVTKKKVPVEYSLTLVATPAEGYHFVNWSDSTSTVLSENIEYTTNTSGPKNYVTNLYVNFAKNIYTINVTAVEGGIAYIGAESTTNANVEHGDEVALTAVANDGYQFVGWYDGDVLVSNEVTYTFTATSDINYTARFNETVVNPTSYAVHITVASTDGTTVTNAPNGNVKAVVELDGQDWVIDYDCPVNSYIKLTATNDFNLQAYLFDGWYKKGELVSKELETTVQVTEAATYEARFFRGCVVIGKSNNNRFGYISSITLADGTSIGYDAANRAAVVAGTSVSLNTRIEMGGYELAYWTDAEGNIVGKENNLIVKVNEDITYTANFEPISYELTVRANVDSYGTVSATSGTATGTTVKVGHNMDATITATANTGYYFVNWTIGTEIVSTSATFTIAGIEEYEDMVDVEYIANFLPVENAVAGTYYRIGYDFSTAANAPAARAAGSTQTITLLETGELGGIKSNSKNSEWNSDYLSMHATGGNGSNPVYAIYKSGTSYFRLFGYTNDANSNTYNSVKYTLSAKEGYVITNCSFSYTQKIAGAVTINYNGASENSNDVSSHDWAITPNAQTVEITLSTTTNNSSNYLTVRNFTVTIQQVGGGEGSGSEGEGSETQANRYYMQSVASNVSGKANALLMTQETGATSIFYYADSKLLSYDKGTYVKEDGTTRGLQAVGTSGTVTITTTGETSTIAAPSYLHAVDGTTRYVDHCGSNTGNNAHANHNFVLEEVTTLPVTISSALHATFYAPVAVAIPEGVKAYVLKAENIPGIETYAWMTSLKNGIIPANTGVIIKGAEGTYNFNIVENNDEARAEAVGNVLSGTVAKTKIIEDAYILANRNGKIGLYPVAKNSYLDTNTNETTVRFTNNSHKAYLPVTNDWFGEQLKKGTGFRFVYDDEETTGIEEFEAEETETIYDLQGRKLSEITQPGIYIVGGKKVWIK